MDLNIDNSHYRVRLATKSDNEDLCTLLATVVSESNLSMIEERNPDFFRLRLLQDPEHWCWLIESKSGNNAPVGCITFVSRSGWVAGKPVKIGYVCDLRLSTEHRKHSIMPRLFRKMAKESWANNYDYVYATTADSNAQMTKVVSIGGGKIWTPYQMKSVTFFGRAEAPAYPVERATSNHFDELTDFLREQEKLRFGGYQIDRALLEQRLDQWDDFTLKNFYICRNEQGKICAVAAPWDTNSIRRSRIVSYSGSMRILKYLYNFEASLRGKMKLPEQGDCFRYLSLTHLNVLNDRPDYFNALLKGIYADLSEKKYHFMSAFIPKGSKLNEGFQGLRTQAVDFRLLIYANPNSWISELDLANYRPGFEMALH